jgi:hypothetical protein
MTAMDKSDDTKPELGEHLYGDVPYADETNKKYTLDTTKHIRAARSYIDLPDNAAKYPAGDVKKIKQRIDNAAKQKGIAISTK